MAFEDVLKRLRVKDLLKTNTLEVVSTSSFTGEITCADLTVSGTFTFGDAAADTLILKGRMSTMTAAGAAIQIDATTCAYGEGMEMRYNLADWADTYTLTSATGMYLRMETNEASSNSLYGMQLYGTTNDVNIGNMWGLLAYAYVKGTSAKTITGVYGIQPEISFDAGSATNTITDAAVVRAKVTGGVMSDYTVLDGFRLTLGDMDGGSRTYGNGLLFEDDSSMSGTCALTTGINLNIAATTGISLAGAMTDGIVIAGACGDNGIEITGACTDSAIQVVTGGFETGLNINADGTTAIAVQSTFTGTTGILLAGTHSNAISITGSSTVAGINIGGDNTIGINIAAQTSSGIDITGASADGLVVSGAMSDNGIEVSGACTGAGISISGAQTGSCFQVESTWALGMSGGALDIGGASTIAFGSVADSIVLARYDLTAQMGTAEKYLIGEYKTYGTSGAGAGTVLQHGIWIGDYCKLTISHNTTDAYATRGRTLIDGAIAGNQFIGVMGQMEFTGAATLEATGGGYAVYGSVTSSGSGTCNRNVAAGYFTMRPNTINLAGQMSCVVADMGGSGYTDYGFLAQVGNNNVGEAAIGIRVSDSAVLPSGIKFSIDTAGSITHAFEFEATNTAYTAATGAVGSTVGKIAIDVAGTTRYFVVYDDVAAT